MPDKYKNKYRIESIRMPNWDYRWNGKYFITICTYKMQHLFGKIYNAKMELSNVGVLADVFWHEIKNHTENIELDAFVVMPNHIHGILIIDNPYRIDENGNPIKNGDTPGNTEHNAGDDGGNDGGCKARACPGSKQSHSPGHNPSHGQSPGARRFQNIGKNSLSSTLGSYKSAVTKHAHRLGYYIKWQERFHDHLIRNDTEYQRIKKYIHNNPKNWNNDKFYRK